MTQEEAIKILRETYDNAPFSVRTALATLISELKESEDESIREEIMEYITLYKDSLDNDEYKSWITWLEKQSEQMNNEAILERRNVSPLLYGIIDSKKREILLKRLEELYNSLGIDTEFNTPDYLIAEYTLNCLVSYGNAVTKNIEKGYIKTLKF